MRPGTGREPSDHPDHVLHRNDPENFADRWGRKLRKLPSTTLALWVAWQYLQVTCHSEDSVGVEVVRRGRGLLA